MLCIHSFQVTPSHVPPALATQLVVQCQPLKVSSRALEILERITTRCFYIISYTPHLSPSPGVHLVLKDT
jgi:hypothetical protein